MVTVRASALFITAAIGAVKYEDSLFFCRHIVSQTSTGSS